MNPWVSEPRGQREQSPSQILADQLNLSQPDGRLCPPHCYPPSPRIFRPSYGSDESFKLSPSVACETDVWSWRSDEPWPPRLATKKYNTIKKNQRKKSLRPRYVLSQGQATGMDWDPSLWIMTVRGQRRPKGPLCKHPTYLSMQHYKFKNSWKIFVKQSFAAKIFPTFMGWESRKIMLLITESFASFSLENANFDSSEAEQRRTKAENI